MKYNHKDKIGLETPEMICAICVVHSQSHTLYSSIAHLRMQSQALVSIRAMHVSEHA
jgi:hypothetical protein